MRPTGRTVFKRIFLIPLVLSLACFTFAGFIMWQRYTPLTVDAAPVEVPQTKAESVVALRIPELGISSPVIPAELDGNKWEYTTKGISYLSSTPLPGEAGNSVLYGHNWPNILGRLPEAKPGMIVEVEFNDAQVKKFIILSTAEVSPRQVDVIEPTDDIRITVFTCSGFFDSKRFVVTAIPQ